MITNLLTSLRATVVLVVLTGLIFPFTITLLAQMIFPDKANGSLIIDKSGRIIGSELIGQNFIKPKYFHPRPSVAGSGYCGESSSGTNLGPTSKKLLEGADSFAGVKQLAERFRVDNGLAPGTLVPVDAVTRSGSGLDPDISQANALLQAPRVAKARNLPLEEVENLVHKYIQPRDFGILGEPRINVLKLNLALDKNTQS